MNDDASVFAFWIGFGIGFLLVMFASEIASRGQDNWWRDELVRRGHAHYYLDEDHNRQWNWKENP